MNSIWNKNISAFSKRFPSLAEMFEKEISFFSQNLNSPDKENLLYPFWNISISKTEKPVASEKSSGLKLHSAYNPEREAENILLQQDFETPLKITRLNNADTFIFEAFGLGYLPIKAAEIFPEKNFILLEPEPERFFAAMLFLDWTKLFEISNLIIAVSCTPDQAMTLINQSGVLNSVFFNNSAQTSHQKEYFDCIDSLIQRNREKEKINNATLERFGKLWTKNSLQNLKSCFESPSILPYKNKAQNLPFTLIAAGPTLEYFLPYLKEIHKKSVTVCVDTALKACLLAGVEPDFIILTDPQYWAYRHIAGLKSPSSILITEASVVPAVYRFPCKKIISCQSNFMLQQIFEKFSSSKGQLVSGGSVASTAWNFCQFSGATEIFTLGLDLSFPENKTHIKGCQFEQTIHTISSKVKTAATTSLPGLFSGNAVFESDYDGNKVLTDQRMKMFAWWFESQIEKFPEIKTYIFTTKSLKIPGIIPESLELLLNKPDISNKNEFTELYKTESVPEITDFEKAVNSFNASLKKIEKYAEDLVLWLKENINSPDSKSKIMRMNQKILEFWQTKETRIFYQLIKVLCPTPSQLNQALLPLSSSADSLSAEKKLFIKEITSFSILSSNLNNYSQN